MSEKCRRLHIMLDELPIINFSKKLEMLPLNGIYFLYEKGEVWGHGSNRQRIVRVGTHRGNGNFRNRISEHFLMNTMRMDFDKDKPRPSDRSILRKNIGKALLYRRNDSYLNIWSKDFIKRIDRENYGYRRNIQKEKKLENYVTKTIRNNFSLKFIVVENKNMRMRLEKHLIGTIAKCEECESSRNWLGRSSPIKSIEEYGLWQTQHLKADEITDKDVKIIEDAIKKTKQWLKTIIRKQYDD